MKQILLLAAMLLLVFGASAAPGEAPMALVSVMNASLVEIGIHSTLARGRRARHCSLQAARVASMWETYHA